MSQNGPKTTSLMTSLTKNPQPPTKKIFLSADNWPFHFSPWTALWHNRRRSYDVGKANDNCWFRADFKVRIYCTPALKVLSN